MPEDISVKNVSLKAMCLTDILGIHKSIWSLVMNNHSPLDLTCYTVGMFASSSLNKLHRGVEAFFMYFAV